MQVLPLTSAWLPLGLAALAPLVVVTLVLLLSRRGRRGVATVIALRTVLVLAFGFVTLTTVATIAVVQTGLRELRQRHLTDVQTLADGLERSPVGVLAAASQLPLTLFRARDPFVSFVAVGTDGCHESCVISAADGRFEHSSLARALESHWPATARDAATVSIDGRLYLLVATPVHGRSDLRQPLLVAGVDAEYLIVQAMRTGWVLLALSYTLLLLVGWTSWKQLRRSLVTRIRAITTQLRVGESDGKSHEMLEVDGHELRELADSVAEYIERSLAERASRDERYRRLVELSPDAVFISTRTGIRFANSAGLTLAGTRNRSALATVPIDRFLELEENPSHDVSQPGLRAGRWTRLDGTVLHVEVAEVTDGSDAEGTRQFLVRDVTNRRMREAALAHRAEHDSLTGLVNRARFEARLTDLLQRTDSAARPGEARDVAVLFIDLDGFKPVNDTYGHAAGDAVLVSIAARLKDCTRGTDLVSRLGGDEFAVLLEVRDPAEVAMVADRILRAIRQPVAVAGALLRVGASIGVATARPRPPESADDDMGLSTPNASDLLRAADAAMYTAKSGGGDRFLVADAQSPALGPDVSFPAVA
jgi:diguanylate cyclase (GGDEF)-like protein